ncbi:GNAT family N-acetyltransferase [Lysinibacillus sp. KCTC 33748]|uniref:GNAT family N-acetyltransferase n=1 Tax=unclassified Lysinibacillus TaxID=2636778 RepID=UPI0009A62830|nr:MULTISPECIES: GNAT family N-acetyltransferase [unclassified Lysinibacillus]OXS72797.1 GNAT family N-acetyltransferase [Lysinibacillus sp. KCTC 33748]SKB88768.1 ribosomal-protein-alanine N-acetyltransferase [Lysinibacillus sp. AC-3]
MEISINSLQERDAEELFQFETDNRLFFEQTVPSRGEDYYKFDTFKIKLRELLAEQEEEKSKFYLIRDNSGNIIGRINLVDIDITNDIAEVGYRVGKEYGGKGIGAKALKLLLETEVSVKKIKAKTTTTNIASQKVLEKNGFKQVCISGDEFEMNGQKMRFIDYMLEL